MSRLAILIFSLNCNLDCIFTVCGVPLLPECMLPSRALLHPLGSPEAWVCWHPAGAQPISKSKQQFFTQGWLGRKEEAGGLGTGEVEELVSRRCLGLWLRPKMGSGRSEGWALGLRQGQGRGWRGFSRGARDMLGERPRPPRLEPLIPGPPWLAWAWQSLSPKPRACAGQPSQLLAVVSTR